MYASALNFLCGFTEPGLHRTWPRSTASLSMPRSRQPTLSPATPSSRSLRNISTPGTTDFWVSRSPTISTSSPTLITPRSMRPVTTVPRPEMENTSSTGIRNGLLISRLGVGMEGARPLAALRNRPLPHRARVPVQRLQRAADHDRGLVPRKLVLGEQLPDFHFHQLQQLLAVHHVGFVQEHPDVGHTD